jgi:HTH-type transcriptional regulator/antitoxin HigA
MPKRFKKIKMKIAPIKNEKDYQKALKELEKVFDAKPNSPEGDLGQMLMLLIEDYEKKHYAIGPPDPIEAIKYMMEEKGLKNKDVIPYFGSKSLVSQVLKRERNLSLKMIKALHKGLGLPYEVLLAE